MHNLVHHVRKERLVAILSPKLSHIILGQITRLYFVTVHHLLREENATHGVLFNSTAFEPPFISHSKDALAALIALLSATMRTLMQCVLD